MTLTLLHVPEPIEFGTADFMPASELTSIGNVLIGREAQFSHLSQAEIIFLWKAKGGQSKGKRKLGACQKPSGLLKHFAECDFVIWVAADHAREMSVGPRELEAIVFHELCHAGLDTDDETGATTWTVVGHDVETFASEIRKYGLWKEDLREMGVAVLQLRLNLKDGPSTNGHTSTD